MQRAARCHSSLSQQPMAQQQQIPPRLVSSMHAGNTTRYHHYHAC